MSSQFRKPTCADLVYDVGMHKGEDTEFYLKKGFRVVAFDADPTLVQSCRERFSSAIAAGQLVIVEGAIVDDAAVDRGQTTVRFFRNLDKTVWGTTEDDWRERNAGRGTRIETVECRAVSFRDALQTYGMPHYLKIDIEGSDRLCLKALLGFEHRPTYLSIESEMKDFSALTADVGLLERLGYRSFQIVQQSTVPRQVPPTDIVEGQYVDHHFRYGSSGLFGRELPGAWKDAPAILRDFRWIFAEYRLCGDGSTIATLPIVHRALTKLLRRDVPGWHDMHARLAAPGRP
jgi:FkbM family methyltransferase